MTKFALEKYRAFPYVAWAIVFGFAFFVLQLTFHVASAMRDMSAEATAMTTQYNYTNNSLKSESSIKL